MLAANAGLQKYISVIRAFLEKKKFGNFLTLMVNDTLLPARVTVCSDYDKEKE